MPTYRAIFVEPESAGNLGFIARLIENFAVDEYFIVNPQCEIGEVAKDRAVHAQETLESARIVDDLEYAITGIDYLVGTTGIDASDENLVRNSIKPQHITEQVPENAVVGLLFGREGTGLSNDELDQCDFVVHIPTAEDYPVMNLSHAAAVIFYECFRGTNSTENRSDSPSSLEERDVLENLFKDTTETLDWEQHRKEKAVRAFRNVLGRSYITNRELGFLIGLFRDVRDKLQENVAPKTNVQ